MTTRDTHGWVYILTAYVTGMDLLWDVESVTTTVGGNGPALYYMKLTHGAEQVLLQISKDSAQQLMQEGVCFEVNTVLQHTGVQPYRTP